MKSYNYKGILSILSVVYVCFTGHAQQKNVLFISVDDLRPELNCYGVSPMVTPNIDALAHTGVLFEKAYVQQALCAPSRISMMTGLYPETTGIFDLNTKIDSKPQYKVLSQSFKENGYECIVAGKIFHTSSDSQSTWSKDPTSYATKDYVLPESIAMKVGNFGPPTENANVADNAYSDGKIADKIISELNSLQDKPFFLVAGFMRPHLPFNAPKKYWDMYNEEDIVVPSKNAPVGASQYASTPWNELRSYVGMPDTRVAVLTDAQTKKLIHGYRASVSFVDAQIGRILAKLDDLGLSDNTIVVLWGDHGFKLGEQGDWAKHTNYELDTRIPLIISSPGMNTGVSNSPVESVDIFPTLMDLCHLNVSESLEGVSLKKIFEDDINHQVRESAYSVYTRQSGNILGRTIRYGNFRYVEWRNKDNNNLLDQELYDHTTSAIALENLADKAAYSSIVTELSEKLNDRFGGPGGIIEDSTVTLLQLSNQLTGGWLTVENTGNVSVVGAATSEVSQWTMTKNGDIATFQNQGTGKYLSADANSNTIIEIDGPDIRAYWKITAVNPGEYFIDNKWKIDNGVVAARMQVSNGTTRLVSTVTNLGAAVIWIENPVQNVSELALQQVTSQAYLSTAAGIITMVNRNTGDEEKWIVTESDNNITFKNKANGNYLASDSSSNNVIEVTDLTENALWIKRLKYFNGTIHLANQDVAVGDDVRWVLSDAPILRTSTIDHLFKEEKVIISPNPSHGLFNIQSGADYSWQLFDATGRVLNQGTINKGSSLINAASNKGLLFLSLKSKNGNLAKTIKVIIK